MQTETSRTESELAVDDVVLEAAETAAAEAMTRTVEAIALAPDCAEDLLEELAGELRAASPEVLVNALYADLEASGASAAELVRARVWELWGELTGGVR
jgi:hypothetical protein